MIHLRAFVLSPLAAAAVACAASDVVVATLPPDAGHDAKASTSVGPDAEVVDAPPPGPPCSTNEDCAPNQYCAKNACGDSLGGCEPETVTCPLALNAVCGCDGVTYWNDCLRQRDGVSASVIGDCQTNVAQCTDPSGTTCPVSDGACARLVEGSASCDPSSTFNGTCWVLPDACPDAGPPGPLYFACGPPLDCVDLCHAILDGTPHQRTSPPGTCPTPPAGSGQ